MSATYSIQEMKKKRRLKIELLLQRVQLLHFIYLSHFIQLQCFSSPAAAALFCRCRPIRLRLFSIFTNIHADETFR